MREALRLWLGVGNKRTFEGIAELFAKHALTSAHGEIFAQGGEDFLKLASDEATRTSEVTRTLRRIQPPLSRLHGTIGKGWLAQLIIEVEHELAEAGG